MRRRALMAGAGLAAAAMVATPVAWARWTGQSTFDATSSAGVLRSPGRLSTSPRASSANDSAVVLTWRVADPGSGSIDPTGYLIERQVAGETGWQARSLSASCARGSCTATDTTAAFDTSYRYRVTSRTGTSWVSDPAAARLAASPRLLDARVGPGSSTLESVAVSPSSDTVVAVGSGGTILVCQGSCADDTNARWVRAASPTAHDLHRVAFAAGGGSAWAVGDAGTLLTCAAACTAPASRWSLVPVPGVSADLYGVFVSGDYLVVVGSHGLARYTENVTSATPTWSDLAFEAGAAPGTRTLYAVAGQDAGKVAVVGQGGFAAGCMLGSGGPGATCGSDAPGSRLSAVTKTPGGGADLHDVAVDGGRYHAAGDSGALYVGTSASGPWTARDGGSGAWKAVIGVGAEVGAVVGGAGAIARCTRRCATPESTWNAQPAGVGADLHGIAGRGAHLWAVGAPAHPGGPPAIVHFNGATWGRQSVSSTLDEGLLARADGHWAAIATRPAGTALPTDTCPAPALRASVRVPAGPRPAIDPVASARLAYRFTASSASSATRHQVVVLASADDGATWTGRALPPHATGTATATATATVTFSGLTWDTSATRTLQLCVAGEGDGATLRLDMLHVDVQE